MNEIWREPFFVGAMSFVSRDTVLAKAFTILQKNTRSKKTQLYR